MNTSCSKEKDGVNNMTEIQAFKKETLLEECIENFHDHIQNMVYIFNKYESMMKTLSPQMYAGLGTKDDEVYTQLVSFLLGENENIYRLKGVGFTNDCLSLLQNKYKQLRKGLMNDYYENGEFLFSEKIFFTFLERMKVIDWDDITLNVYQPKYIEDTNIIDFMNITFEEYKEFYDEERDVYTCKKMIEKLDGCFSLLIETFKQLTIAANKSKSAVITSIIVRESVDVMIVTYVALSTIETHSV